MEFLGGGRLTSGRGPDEMSLDGEPCGTGIAHITRLQDIFDCMPIRFDTDEFVCIVDVGLVLVSTTTDCRNRLRLVQDRRVPPVRMGDQLELRFELVKPYILEGPHRLEGIGILLFSKGADLRLCGGFFHFRRHERMRTTTGERI